MAYSARNQTIVAYFCRDAGKPHEVQLAVGEGRYATRATVVGFEGKVLSSHFRGLTVGPEGHGGGQSA